MHQKHVEMSELQESNVSLDFQLAEDFLGMNTLVPDIQGNPSMKVLSLPEEKAHKPERKAKPSAGKRQSPHFNLGARFFYFYKSINSLL